jgi:glycosyltransferase involved in cell wall biosynthesis
MRIGVDARPLSYQLTGIGVYLRNILNELQEVDSRNKYYLISNGQIHFRLRNPRWTKIEGRLKLKLLSTLWMQAVAPIITVKQKLDLFWGPRHHLPFFLPPRVRGVLTIHDVVHRFYPKTMALPNLLVERLLMKRSIQRADAIIADTYSTAGDLQSEFEVESRKVFPVHLGKPELPRRKDAEKAFNDELPSKFFLFVGTLDPRKNFNRIMKAFTLLNPVASDVHLLIVGGAGWKNKGFLEVLSEHPLRSYVSIKGYVPADFLTACYEKAVCLVFPSLYEGFGLPILEAMSCGTPVITSNVSAMKEVAGDAALLVNPQDTKALKAAMKRLLEDKRLRKRLREKGWQRVKEFTWRRCAEETLKILNMFDRGYVS